MTLTVTWYVFNRVLLAVNPSCCSS